jgi:hypothetical protein
MLEAEFTAEGVYWALDNKDILTNRLLFINENKQFCLT